MKKLLIALLILLGLCTTSFAAQNTTVSRVDYSNFTLVTITWEGHATGGAVLPAALYGLEGMWLYEMVTDPGSTAPTDNYDVYLYWNGYDILGLAGENRDTATTEAAFPTVGTAKVSFLVPGTLNFALSGNSVNSAVGTIYLVFGKFGRQQ